jgi:hypothetical protein
MDQAHHNLIQPHLVPGEHLLWTGQPDARRMTRNYVLPGVGAAAVVFVVLGIMGVNLPALLLFSGAMAAVSLFMGLFWIYPDSRRTLYVLTNQRILIMNTKRGNLIGELHTNDIGNIQSFARKDGSGDLFFANEQYRRSRRRGKTRHFGFVGIDDVRTVEQQVSKIFPETTDPDKLPPKS